MTSLSSVLRAVPILAALLYSMTPASAQDAQFAFGGDRYAAGQQTNVSAPVEGDAFLAGYDVTLNAPVTGSAHLGGFNVTSNADVDGNLYGAGFTVHINAPITGNLSATGSTVGVTDNAAIGGNARLAGASVSLAAPVEGSVLVSADALTLSGTIAGDFSFFGRTITFAPDARIDGTVQIHAPENIAVPASVAAPDRVSFSVLEDADYLDHAGRTAENVVRGFWPAFWGLAVFWLVLVIAGAVLMAFMPKRLANMQIMSETRPFRSLGWGALTFAMLLGLVPLTAMTIIGIFIVPFVLIFIAVCLGLAYALGAYLLGTRVTNAFVTVDTNLKRLIVMAISLIIVVLLGIIPFIGWLLTLIVVAFGLGTTARTAVMPRDERGTGAPA
ncbi:hypothetical protein [Pelagibacterium halotolerans]|uniref:hypothetical protein n=1 Tax=Pelagibacterium halotolerans TaxID=531813 RepID=UPI00384F8043